MFPGQIPLARSGKHASGVHLPPSGSGGGKTDPAPSGAGLQQGEATVKKRRPVAVRGCQHGDRRCELALRCSATGGAASVSKHLVVVRDNSSPAGNVLGIAGRVRVCPLPLEHRPGSDALDGRHATGRATISFHAPVGPLETRHT